MSIYTPVVNRFEQKDNFVRLWKFTFLLPPTESAMLSVLLDCDKYITTNRLPEDERYFKCSKEGYLKKMLPGLTEDMPECFTRIAELLDYGAFELCAQHGAQNTARFNEKYFCYDR